MKVPVHRIRFCFTISVVEFFNHSRCECSSFVAFLGDVSSLASVSSSFFSALVLFVFCCRLEYNLLVGVVKPHIVFTATYLLELGLPLNIDLAYTIYINSPYPWVPKFAGSNPTETVGFFRAKKSSARLPSEGK